MGYEAVVLADSVSPAGIRLTTLLVTMPRFILAEFNTHRMFSRNSASSRAIPVEKRIRDARRGPFVPEAFMSNRPGMQACDPLEAETTAQAELTWYDACQAACNYAEQLMKLGVHKQWANRLIEPYCWHRVVVTATEWDNFWHQRISEFAQPEMRRTAEVMKAAYDTSTPKRLDYGEWHLPFYHEKDRDFVQGPLSPNPMTGETDQAAWRLLAKLSVARCARVSYLTHDGRRDEAKDLELHDFLMAQGHMSPFEHVARPFHGPETADHAPEFSGNFCGWKQYRKLLYNEADPCNPALKAPKD